MKYQDLDSYVEYLRSFPRFSVREYLKLDRIKAMLRLLGHPERKLRGFQVAGTNGKGTTVAFVASALKEAGNRVGAFYSPHLISYTERFQINGQPISQARFAQLIARLKPVVKRVWKKTGDQPTWFEVLTAAAALYFAEEKVDWVVFEVGLGGRLDATTALGLKYKIITEIGFDHSHILGRTISRIAREKAGIITRRNTVFTSNVGTSYRVIRRQCRKTNSQLFEAPLIQIERVSFSGTNFSITDQTEVYSAQTPFVGERQAVNAGLVFQCLRQTLGLPPKVILKGLSKARQAGRFQIASRKPFVILDGAHNVPAIRHLLATLDQLGITRGRLIVVFGAKTRKNYRAMVRLLGSRSKKIFFPVTGIPNMVSPEVLKCLCPAGRVGPTLREAIHRAKAGAGKKDVILVTGSFYLIGEALRLFGRQKETRVDRIDDNQAEQKRI